jgi:hypothetical protein
MQVRAVRMRLWVVCTALTLLARAQACLRLRGGGGDGGSTGAESRSSYLEMYKTQKVGQVRCSGVWASQRTDAQNADAQRCPSPQMDAREEQLATWTCCRLTRQPLGGADGKQAVVRTCVCCFAAPCRAPLTRVRVRR